MTKKPKTSAHTITQQENFSLANRIMLDQSLSPATRLVGWYITDHINTRRGYAWPPQEIIAKNLGITARTVRRAIKDLAPYFAIDRSHRQHEYRIATPDNLSGVTTPDADRNGGQRANVTPDKFSTTPDIFSATPDKLSDHPSNHPTNHPSNSALAIARAASTDVDDAPKRLATFERKFRKGSCSRQERKAGRDLCDQIFEEREPGDPTWERANRLRDELD